MCRAESHNYSRTIFGMVTSSMTSSPPQLRTILAVICLPVLACLLGLGTGASRPVVTLLVGLAAACAAWITTRQTTLTQPAPETASAPPQPMQEQDPKLRHDIRGIISPAMLAAEQLSLNQDPVVQKAASTINDSLDRLTARLKQRPSG
ncbi:hypothetical protein AA18895_1890 [Acetobacter ghanensis DSM 18895]|nr:hypothetical protein AA18895_1890 [Acetobacter ghanensis DSM 18895]